MLKKIGIVLLIIILFIALAVGFGKNFIVKTAVTATVKAMTGLKLTIGDLNIGVVKTLVGINDLKLYNPSGFTDNIMIDLPQALVDYDLKAFFNKKIHLEKVLLNLKEFIVVKNKDGALNLDSLNAVQAAKEDESSAQKKTTQVKGKMPEIQIDLLELKVGKVIYKDYSQGGSPRIREYNLNLDEKFENITNLQDFARLIIVRALARTPIASLADFDLGALSKGLDSTLKDTQIIIKDGAVKKTADILKKLLHF